VSRRVETRAAQGTVEIRAASNGGPVISGYAAVFNSPSSEDLGFVETVDPGAFDKTLSEADVRGLGNHDPSWLLGRSGNGTLRLSVDATGLRYEIDVNENDPDGVRALEKVRRGDWVGSSFSFQAIRDEWDYQVSPPTRRLLEVKLIDVAPVTFAAYEQATVSARSMLADAARDSVQAREATLAALRARIPADGRTARHSATVSPGIEALMRRVELVGLELRAGRVLSAANVQALQDIIDGIEQILADAGAIDQEGGV
jgi:HK97 family phage prohead protease